MKAITTILGVLIGSIAVSAQPPNNCPEPLTCDGSKEFAVQYCSPGVGNQNRLLVDFCFKLPFPDPLVDGVRTYSPVKYIWDLPFCAYVNENAAYQRLEVEIVYYGTDGTPYKIFDKDDMAALLDDIVEEINCLCTSDIDNNEDGEDDCCFSVGVEDNPVRFLDVANPDVDASNTLGIALTFIMNTTCKQACGSLYGPTQNAVTLNSTDIFTQRQTGSVKQFFYTTENQPDYDEDRYEAYSARTVIQHELLHMLGIRIHYDVSPCQGERAEGGVMNEAYSPNSGTKYMSDDEKCHIMGLYCPSSMTVGVYESSEGSGDEVFVDETHINIEIPLSTALGGVKAYSIVGQEIAIGHYNLFVGESSQTVSIEKPDARGALIIVIIGLNGELETRLVMQ